MQQLTSNVYAETDLRGANHGLVTTSDGIVMIDSPHKPSDALKLRAEIARRGGRLRYIINTEPHGDHWTGNAFFNVPVIAHEGVRTRILETDMKEHVARVATFGPEEPGLLENYRPNAPVDHVQGPHDAARRQPHLRDDRHARATPRFRRRSASRKKASCSPATTSSTSATPGCRKPIPTSGWSRSNRCAASRKRCSCRATGRCAARSYLDEQGSFIQEWKAYVQKAVDRGMTKDEAVEKLTGMTDRYPMDIGQDGMAPSVMKRNVANLYDYFTRTGAWAPAR